VTSWAALEADPPLASGYTHVVAVDPPAHEHLGALLQELPGEGWMGVRIVPNHLANASCASTETSY